MTYIAFYKGKGDFYDKIIKLWTNSIYSHVEIIPNLTELKMNIGVSSSMRDGGVRGKLIDFYSENWDIFHIELNEKEIYDWLYINKDKKYDLKGIILTHFIKLNHNNSNEYFCSEAIAEILNMKNPSSYTPKSLFDYLESNKLIINLP